MVRDVRSAVALAVELEAPELVVGGGAEIYEAALPIADELVLTVIETAVDGRVRFPDFQTEGNWVCRRRERHEADSENPHAMEFQWWFRPSLILADQSAPSWGCSISTVRLMPPLGENEPVRERRCGWQTAIKSSAIRFMMSSLKLA